ncbi:MAG: hypothetical protein HYX69_09510 [Planctomycetia bacterium]|nr:hypothetical protein [Planctomycetia bacterium]
MTRYLGSCATLLWLAACVPAMGATLFSDNFDSGVSGANWTLVTAGQNLLQGDSAHFFGTQSAKQVNAFGNGTNDVYYMRTQPGTIVTGGGIGPGQKEIAAVQFWDDNIRTDQNGDSSINLGGTIMLANNALSDFYQLGVNSAVSVNNYYMRTSLGGNVATGVARTQGWHELRIEALPYTGSGDVQFYIDNVLVGSGNRRPNTGSGFDLNEIRLGLSIRTPDSPFWFDNASVSMVPEPSSIVLITLALVGLVGYHLGGRRQG